MFIVNPFLWHTIDDGTYFFQTQTSSVMITNARIAEFLIEIEKRRCTYIEEEEFYKIFGIETKNILRFLEDNRILKKKEEQRIDIKRIVIVSDDNFFVRVIQEYFSDIHPILAVSNNDIQNFDYEENDLILSYIKHFSIEELELLRQCSEKNDSYLKVIFPYDSKIYFTNFYKKSWYTPCPLCFFYELEGQLRGESGEYSITFQTLMDFIYTKKANFQYEVLLSKMDYLSIGFILSKYLKSNMDESKFNEIIELDLKNGRINRDISYHWGYCDCYE